MRKIWLALLALALPSVVARAEPPPRLPMRDFFKNPDKAQFSLSPDGKYLAYRAPWQHRFNVFVQPVAGGPAKRITAETERDIPSFFWKGSSHIVYLKDSKGDENFHLVVVGRDGSGLKDLTPFDKVKTQVVDDLVDDDHTLLIEINKRKAEVFDAYRVNVDSKELTLAAENPGNVSSWYADHQGRIRAAVTTDGVNTSLLYRADEKQPFKTVLTTNFRESVGPLFFTFDDKQLCVSSNRGRDKSVIAILDPDSGKETQVLFEHPEVDVGTLDYSHKRKLLRYAEFVTWKPERHYFDAATEKLHHELEAKLPGYEVEVTSENRAEDRFIVTAYNDRTRGTRYLYDAKAHALTKLADVSPWLDEKQMATMKPIKYTARDGLTINGYLTLPTGVEAKELPLVVNPHGGPWARDQWGFNPELQFLANRGYAVLQVEFRGSTGYGRRFWEASFKQWGKKMQDDVSDGLKYVIGQGIVDPKRVCIYGGSYGGYATLAGLAFSPELYACGVDYVGVANLFTWMKAFPPYWKPYLDMVHDMVGDPEKDKAAMTATSPVFHADRIRVPLLVAQGAHDPRVNIEESNQMVAALKKRGIDVTYMVKDNEGHGFRNEENRFDFYQAMEDFLAKHLKPPTPKS
jgi:dipeptidyl aminopeptidase/acylaminoacyl peptidase